MSYLHIQECIPLLSPIRETDDKKIEIEGKVIGTKTINGLQSFIEKFKDLNFVGDVQVEAQLAALNKELLNAYPASQFKEDKSLQEELKRKLNEISDTVNKTDINSVTGEYKRKVVWE